MEERAEDDRPHRPRPANDGSGLDEGEDELFVLARLLNEESAMDVDDSSDDFDEFEEEEVVFDIEDDQAYLVADRFEVVSRLGMGPHGEVFLANDHDNQRRRVALKILRPETGPQGTSAVLERAEDIFRRTDRLHSDHLNRWRASGLTEDGRVWLSSDLVEGESAFQLGERTGAIPPRQAFEIARQALLGLEKAHALGIPHGHVVQENVLLQKRVAWTEENPFGVGVRLVDHGLRSIVGSQPSPTPSGDLLGVASVLAGLLAGTRIADDGSDWIGSEGAVSTAALSGPAKRVLDTSMAADPSARYADAAAFRAAIERTPEWIAREPKSKAVLVAGAVFGLGVLASAPLWWGWFQDTPDAEPDENARAALAKAEEARLAAQRDQTETAEELEALRIEREELAARAEEIQREREAEAERARIAEQERQAEAQRAALAEQELESLRGSTELTANELETLRGDQRETTEELEALRKEREELAQRATAAEEELQNLRGSTELTTSELEELRDSQQATTEELDALRKEREALAQRTAEAEREKERLEALAAAAEAEKTRLDADLSSTKERLAELEARPSPEAPEPVVVQVPAPAIPIDPDVIAAQRAGRLAHRLLEELSAGEYLAARKTAIAFEADEGLPQGAALLQALVATAEAGSSYAALETLPDRMGAMTEYRAAAASLAAARTEFGTRTASWTSLVSEGEADALGIRLGTALDQQLTRHEALDRVLRGEVEDQFDALLASPNRSPEEVVYLADWRSTESLTQFGLRYAEALRGTVGDEGLNGRALLDFYSLQDWSRIFAGREVLEPRIGEIHVFAFAQALLRSDRELPALPTGELSTEFAGGWLEEYGLRARLLGDDVGMLGPVGRRSLVHGVTPDGTVTWTWSTILADDAPPPDADASRKLHQVFHDAEGTVRGERTIRLLRVGTQIFEEAARRVLVADLGDPNAEFDVRSWSNITPLRAPEAMGVALEDLRSFRLDAEGTPRRCLVIQDDDVTTWWTPELGMVRREAPGFIRSSLILIR